MNLQTKNQSVVEVENQYSGEAQNQIRIIRKDQWTIIITAITFGLTLNLISDFLGSFYDNTIEPVTFWYRGLLALIAGIITIISMGYLVWREYRKHCEKESQIEMMFFFNEDSGEPYFVPNYIPVDRLAGEYAKSPDKQKELLVQLVKKVSEVQADISPLVPLLEYLTIYEITHRQIPSNGISKLSSIKDLIRLKTPPIGRHIRAYGFKIPGEFSLDYQQCPKGGSITISWKDGYHGKVTIDFEFLKGYIHRRNRDLLLVDKPGSSLHLLRFIVQIKIKSKFSWLRLFFRRGNTEKLIMWTNRLSDRLIQTADWNQFIKPYEEAEKQKFISIPLFEANE